MLHVINEVSFYDVLFWFYAYSFIGWIFESTYVSVHKKKFVNRGFITGPLCTVYGSGAVAVILILWSYQDNLLMLFAIGLVATTVLEYLTSVAMELLFKTRWWDYSHKKFHYHGRICLESSVAWGIFSVILLKLLHPLVSQVIALMPIKTGTVILYGITLLFIIDFGVAVIAALQLTDKLQKLDGVITEITKYISNTKLYESKEELKEKMEVLRSSFDELWEERKIIMLENLERRGLGELKKEILDKLEGFTKHYNSIKDKTNFLQDRYLRAYPQIKLVTVSMKERIHKMRKVKTRKSPKDDGTKQ